MPGNIAGLSFRLFVLIIVALMTVSCGRRGNLEAPSSTSIVTVDESEIQQDQTDNQAREDKPFILDPLL